jgi:DNA-binding transcriptional LysR family regulator
LATQHDARDTDAGCSGSNPDPADTHRDAVIEVASLMNPGQFLLAPLIRPFLERYPGIRLSLNARSVTLL